MLSHKIVYVNYVYNCLNLRLECKKNRSPKTITTSDDELFHEFQGDRAGGGPNFSVKTNAMKRILTTTVFHSLNKTLPSFMAHITSGRYLRYDIINARKLLMSGD